MKSTTIKKTQYTTTKKKHQTIVFLLFNLDGKQKIKRKQIKIYFRRSKIKQ